MARPQAGDFGTFYQAYINLASSENIESLIANYSKTILDFIENIPEAKADFSYADGKWTVKQLLQHMIDTERIFVFRAITFARKDTVALAGFDENLYANNAPATNRSLADLKKEFSLVRQSTDLFLLSLTDENLHQKGTASNNNITVNSIAFIIFGHNLHHVKVLQNCYL